ncbi:TetR/AcrR family transcriptional regulator [Rhizobium sp. TRM95111]|uniref:TetR/AcrR family transcriptional regulator n=1 Tax=Rhizobium alarense TaxID=2846851 RepID=UPI001F196588|nr:TetR/AcrR family transcriptional regulator [Rhizobium alarense]MCF3639816.1 TetR/AcrR family transcriptional regulator [Rhizobium alarense]
MESIKAGSEGLRVGRPLVLTPEERRGRILESAEKLFVESGYVDTTMVRIAARAGMSKRTLYETFPDKREIFTAVVNFQNSVPPLPPVANDDDPRRVLRDTLVHIAHFLLEPRRIALARLAIAEARSLPDVTQNFFENAYDVLTRLVVERLELLIGRGQITIVDTPQSVAELLLGATLGDSLLRYLGFPDRATELQKEELSRRATAAITMMAAGLGLPSS